MLVVSTNKESKENYIGPAPLEEMARYDIPLTLAYPLKLKVNAHGA